MPKTEPIIDLEQTPDGTYIPAQPSHRPRHAAKARERRPRQKAKTEQRREPATGRLDMLVKGTVEKLVEGVNNPLLTAFYHQAKPTLDAVFEEKLRPPRRIS